MGQTSPSMCIEVKDGTHIAKCVLMPGDPLRAKYVAENYLENPVLFNDVRGMLGYTGLFEGREVSVMGSGMGIPSITLYATELYSFFGVESIIRIGSAGGIGDDIQIRDLLLAMTASSTSAYSDCLAMPGHVAPCATWDLLKSAYDIAQEMNVKTTVGSVLSSDYFYYPNPDAKINEKAKDLGILAVEMESAGLYLTAMRLHKKALAMFQISDHVFTGAHLDPKAVREGFHEMMEVALKTAVRAGS